MFSAASIHISSSGKATVGSHCTFTAKISGKYLDSASIRWYTNGTEVTRAAGQTSVPVLITDTDGYDLIGMAKAKEDTK